MTMSHPGATDPGTSQDPEALRAEIARTRADMDTTLAQLEDRVSPSRIRERQTEKVRSRWRSARESVMGSASGGAGSVGDAAGSAQGAVQQAPERAEQMTRGNPLAAGLIAFGVGALAGSLLPTSDAEEELAGGLRDTFEEPVKQQLQSAAQDVRGELQDHAQHAAEDVKMRAEEAVATTKEGAQNSAQQVQDRAR